MAGFTNFHTASSLLCDGAVVSLWSKMRGNLLYINDNGDVHGGGERHKSAEWKVHERGDGMVAFQNEEHHGKWLRIKDEKTDCNGTGGNFCNFRITEHDNGYISLESDKHPGQHIGIYPDQEGALKPSVETGKGAHGHFTIILKSKGPKHMPMMSSTHLLKHGAQVFLFNRSCARTMKYNTDEVVGAGRSGDLATFIVDVKAPGVVTFRGLKEPNRYLCIKDGQTSLKGSGGKFCNFFVHDSDNGFISLESCEHRECHVGIVPDGTPKDPSDTKRGFHGQFWVIIREASSGAHSAMSTVKSAPMNALSEKAVVHFFSRARGAYLCLEDSGKLIANDACTDKTTEWKVHHYDDGTMGFKNEKHSDKWLRIKDDKVDCEGTGGNFCKFRIINHDNGYVSLESWKHGGQHVGVFPETGEMKPSNQTGRGNHGHWYIVLDELSKKQMPVTPGYEFLKDGASVVLCARSRGRTIRFGNGDSDNFDGNGRTKELAVLKVHVRRPGEVALQHEKFSDHWLRIKDGHTDMGGKEGGKFTFFYVHCNEFGCVCLESVENRSQHVGIKPNGDVKPPGDTGSGKHGQFYVVMV